ncbi:efflux transporter outer membrane subunit [Paenalcaligenes suwonensis]|uniref:efflux transporter outer membrane subunit n=1 Tax=Paenalcaligenes suwonensis TaxID=1202713 RepID=UPI00140B2BC4|nr:efflux transporter outer membrane subunit [Paenalcaligenes suwonensis]NHC62089.1 efflux transporter outer membrane subunit [Paenalcaligenes suwonensis]
MYQPPPSLPDQGVTLPDSWAQQHALLAQAPEIDPASWWNSFNDPILNALVAKTQAENLSVAQAAYRLHSARALVQQTVAAGLPEISVKAETQHQRKLSSSNNASPLMSPTIDGDLAPDSERTTGYYQAGFDAAWELDLFGRVSSQRDSAQSAVGVAYSDLRHAHVSVVAEVVRNYIELRAQQQRLALVEQNLADQNTLFSRTQEQHQTGLIADYEQDQIHTNLISLQQQQLQLQQAIQQNLLRLAVLTGQSSIDESLAHIAVLPNPKHLGFSLLPAELLRVRPAIQQAEFKVAQAGAELGVAQAELYPRLRLLGSLSISDNLSGTPLLGRTEIAGGSFSLNLPLLDWGARRAVVNAREAQLAEAILAYKEAVLEGVEETENALLSIYTHTHAIEQAQQKLQFAERALYRAQELYQQGMIPMHELLDASLKKRNSQIDVVNAQAEQAAAIIALHKAVGGAQLPVDLLDMQSRLHPHL